MIGPHWKINKFEGKNITKSMPGTMVVQTQKKKTDREDRESRLQFEGRNLQNSVNTYILGGEKIKDEVVFRPR